MRKRNVTNEAGNKFTLLVKCDLSGLTEDQIKEYAFDAIWIKEQSNMRAMSNKAFEEMNGNYTFKAVPKGTRAVLDPVTTANKAIEKMTIEEKRALRKQLEALG